MKSLHPVERAALLLGFPVRGVMNAAEAEALGNQFSQLRPALLSQKQSIRDPAVARVKTALVALGNHPDDAFVCATLRVWVQVCKTPINFQKWEEAKTLQARIHRLMTTDDVGFKNACTKYYPHIFG